MTQKDAKHGQELIITPYMAAFAVLRDGHEQKKAEQSFSTRLLNLQGWREWFWFYCLGQTGLTCPTGQSKKNKTKNCRFMYMQLHKIHNNRYKRPQASVVARKKCKEKLENIALPSFPTREGHFNVSNIPAQKLCNCANKITNVSFSSPLHKSRHRSNLKVRNIREKFFN